MEVADPVSEVLSDELLAKYPPKPFKTLIPYGYKKGGDPHLALELGVTEVLVPDPILIKLLDEALDQLDAGATLQSMTDWLNSKNPDRTISIMGLLKIRKQYRPNHPKKPSALPKRKKPVKVLTPEEREAKKTRLLLAQEKKKITYARRRQEKLEQELGLREDLSKIAKQQEKTAVVMELDFSSVEDEDLTEALFKPNPGPQAAFFAASEQEVLYGGAAGGGKSYALIVDPLRYAIVDPTDPLAEIRAKNFKGIILRRTLDELRDLIKETKGLYPQADPKATYRENDKEWRFSSGATLTFSYLDREDDVERYRGLSFTWVGFDELTQYSTPYAWNFLRSRLRDSSGTLPLHMRATSNPGGVGHGWVKRMFIDPAPPGKAFWAQDIDTGETLVYPPGHAKAGQPLFQRKFIPAKVKDNPYLWNDGVYETNLLSLPEQQRRQLLDGDWDAATGAAFPEFRQSIHVVEPYKIPSDWRRFRSCDFGYSEKQYSAVHWYAIHPATGQLIVYRELYVNQHTGAELARKILACEEGEKIAYGVLDSSVWAQRGQTGPSIAEEMRQWGVRWRPSDRSQGSRAAGRLRLHELLRVDRFNQQPGIVFFNTCRKIIGTLPIIPTDPDGTDDIDVDFADDHAYDSLRYGVMSRPRPGSSGFDDMPTTSRHREGYLTVDPSFGY